MKMDVIAICKSFKKQKSLVLYGMIVKALGKRRELQNKMERSAALYMKGYRRLLGV